MLTGILQIVLKLLGSDDGKSNQKMKSLEVDSNDRPKITVVKGQPTPEFKYGMNHAWIMFQLAMFKMYKEDELLDYDSLFEAISHNMDSISSSADSIKKWNEDYIEYLQSKEHFNDPDIDMN